MRPRSALSLAALAAAPLLGSATAHAATLSGKKPNIIFIFTDDHAWQAMGAYGSRFGADVTPRLDAMAKEGVTFENCVCGNPLSGPSRAIVLTGKFSHANRYFSNEYSPDFDGKQETLPKVMARAGYQSAILGKWHLGGRPVGFDHFDILPGHGRYYNPEFISPKGKKVEEGYITDLLADKAIDWMKNGRDASKPFVLMVHHKAPHRNWQPGPNEVNLWPGRVWPEPANLRDDYKNRAKPIAEARMRISQFDLDNDLHMPSVPNPEKGSFAGTIKGMTPDQREKFTGAFEPENAAFRANRPKGDELLKWKYQRYITEYMRCIKGVDNSVGRILDHLKASGLDENTLVVYSSDQGFFLGEHGLYDKRLPYVESVRMPLLVRWPGKLRPGSRVPAIVQNTDFLPTFMDLAGLPPDKTMHGKSMLPLMTGQARALRDAAYTHFYEHTGEHNAAANVALRTNEHLLVRYYDTNETELFDLKKDPHEMRSVADEPAYASTRKRLEARLAAMAAEYGDKTLPWGDDDAGVPPHTKAKKKAAK